MNRRGMLKTAAASSVLLAGAGGVVKPAFAVPKADKGRKRIIHIRHAKEPRDNRTDTFFFTRGFDSVIRWPFAGDTLEMPDERLAGAVINGGGQWPFDDYKRYPWLKTEFRFIEECLKRDIPLIGICMGAQQIVFIWAPKSNMPRRGVRSAITR